MFISQHYIERPWINHEMPTVRAIVLNESDPDSVRSTPDDGVVS
jgi:hypothetical protein